MGDQIVVMRDGRIEQTGAPLDLYDFPANTFVAGFIGSPSMNFIHGEIAAEGDAPELRFGDGMSLALPKTNGARIGAKATLGLRPEHLEVVDPDGALPAVVKLVEPTGPETLVVCQVGDDHGAHAADAGRTVELLAALRDRRPLKPGDAIGLRHDVGRAHLFDGDTGDRLPT